MEQWSSRMYSGPLSQAALKVLAVLRAQNQDESRRNRLFSSNQRPMERYTYSHMESLGLTCWNNVERTDDPSYRPQVSLSSSDPSSPNELQISQPSSSRQHPQTPDGSLSSQPSSSSSCWESSLQRRTPQKVTCYQDPQTFSHRMCSETSSYPSSQDPSVSQREAPETEATLCQPDRYLHSFQTPDRPTSCRTSAGRIRPPFIPDKFPEKEGADELFEPATDQPDSHSVVSHTTEICEETDNMLGSQSEDKSIWNIGRNELEDNIPLGCHLKLSFDETRGGIKDGDDQQSKCKTIRTDKEPLPPSDFVKNYVGHTVETAERDHTEGPVVQPEPSSFVLDQNGAPNLEKTGLMFVTVEDNTEQSDEHVVDTGQMHCSEIQHVERQRNLQEELLRINTAGGQRGDHGGVLEVPLTGGKETADSGGERCPMPTLSQECGAGRSMFEAICLRGNQQDHAIVQSANGSSRGSKSTFTATGLNFPSQNLTSAVAVKNKTMRTNQSHHPPVTPAFTRKRKRDMFQHHHANPPHKIHQTNPLPKWESPRSLQEKVAAGVVSESKKVRVELSVCKNPTLTRESQTEISLQTTLAFGVHQDSQALKQVQQSWVCKEGEPGHEITSKQTPLYKPRADKWATSGTDPSTDGPRSLCDGVDTKAPQTKPSTLTSDARVKDSGKLNPEERLQMLEETTQAKVVILTMVFQDGTTQLDPEQKLTPAVCGLLVLMKNDLPSSTAEDSLGSKDSLVYLKLEHTPLWVQQQLHHTQERFARDVLLRVLGRSQLVVCYKAKDLLRTALQYYKEDLSWKQVAGCQIHDPQVSGWLLDPTDPSSNYKDLLYKHCQKTYAACVPASQKVSQIISSLNWLYRLNMSLCSKLQSLGLWELYSEMELKMIPVLAVMESHHIHVDKEALRRTSDLLGTKMKHLEQEAHRAAGQIFLLTSSTQLRTVLFEKLRLHERCENKKLPKTINKQHPSTSEAALLQLQDLHPLPKIILEYRQVHKIKSTFVDGILSCMKRKSYISSAWYQTSVVTGRISAKHPNFQALPRQPLQVNKLQYIQGKEEEVVTVHPRAMFIPQEGQTFLAADFCQVELRLLAHFSSDPELLRIFTSPQADVFTMLASQWKGVSVCDVTSEDREHAKRVVYSVVYGAGRERLSGILGVSAEQASRFQDSFLQTYRDVQAFIQRTIQQSHKQGYVVSIMGRRRNLPNINSPDWAVRMQAERQAVNFVLQGSAADLCKMAMISIFKLLSSSSSLSARLLAQLHDELLYEVEDSQVEQFAALVRSTMESLQHIEHLGVHLKVPLKVVVSCGKSWGSMSELHTPPLPASPP